LIIFAALARAREFESLSFARPFCDPVLAKPTAQLGRQLGTLEICQLVTNGKAEPSPFIGWLCRKERVERLLLHLGGYASAIIANPDFDAIAEVLGRGGKQLWIRRRR